MSSYRQVFSLTTTVAALLLLGGCSAGSKVLKEPLPFVAEEPLVVGQDERLSATLDWVIVQGGPGTWAKNARWDEYLVSAIPTSASPVQITDVRIVDAFDLVQPSYDNRRLLFKASKETEERYETAGYDPKPGEGMDLMMKVGTGGAAVGALTGAAAGGLAVTFGASSSAVAAGAAAGAVLFAAPVFAVRGIIRGSYHGKVDAEIAQRQTVFPIALTTGEPTRLHVFVPITPAPQRLEIEYEAEAEAKTLSIQLDEVLGSLHLSNTMMHQAQDDDAPGT